MFCCVFSCRRYVSLNSHYVILSSHYVILSSHYVILNGVKNLEVSVAVDSSTSLEILRFTQDDIVGVVILNAHLVMLNSHYVILNGVKKLSVCAGVRPLCYPVDPSFHSG